MNKTKTTTVIGALPSDTREAQQLKTLLKYPNATIGIPKQEVKEEDSNPGVNVFKFSTEGQRSRRS